MSSILSRIFRRKSRRRKTVARVQFSRGKTSRERSRELERVVESCDALAMLKKRRPRPQPKNEEDKIKLFEKWCAEVGIKYHSNVKIQREGICSGLGVIATADISQGECVATVPITSVLACVNSDVQEILKAHRDSFSTSWIPLLLTMAYEYSCESSSMWFPYLSIVPNDLSPLPMMWEESVRENLLEGAGVGSWVSRDLDNISSDYYTMVTPIVDKYPDVFRTGMQDIEMYKRYVGYVMSYSFTDEKAGLLGGTMLVPFVDIINHSSYNNVKLTFHPKHLKLMAIKDIHKGEEVLNTYGEHSNASLLHMYGFTEEKNGHVEAVIQCELVKDVFLKCFSNPTRWDSLLHLGILEEEYSVSVEGQPEQALLVLAHLLSSTRPPKKVLQSLQQDSFQSLEDCSKEELTFLAQLVTPLTPHTVPPLLHHRLAEQCLKQYPEEVCTPAPEAVYGVSRNEMNAWRVALGQQDSLRALRTLTT